MKGARYGMAAANPFGKWTAYRAKIAAMSRTDARNPVAEGEARQLLIAARLADAIIRDRDALSSEQRAVLAELFVGGCE